MEKDSETKVIPNECPKPSEGGGVGQICVGISIFVNDFAGIFVKKFPLFELKTFL